MRQEQTATTSRAARSPAKFAEAFGRHPTWAYRLLYAGKIRAISGLGSILMPETEVQRLLDLAQPYNPKPRKPKTQKEEAGQAS